MRKPIFDFSNLSPDERIQLAEDLWDSLAETPESVALTEAQGKELDRRVEAYQKDRDPGKPWNEVLRGIKEPSR
ncbi:MAG TPA: addiction module protein [Thermoanaerobaculia bacterium]|jgi:putative addiction module component (TIGR02574 family)